MLNFAPSLKQRITMIRKMSLTPTVQLFEDCVGGHTLGYTCTIMILSIFSTILLFTCYCYCKFIVYRAIVIVIAILLLPCKKLSCFLLICVAANHCLKV